MNASISTPKPKQLPKDLTKLSKAYVFKATIAILSVVLFFTLYAELLHILLESRIEPLEIKCNAISLVLISLLCIAFLAI